MRISDWSSDVCSSDLGRGHDVRHLDLRQVGQRIHAGNLHRLVDAGRADVEGAAEDEGKTQDVVYLVRVIGPAGGDHPVVAHRLDVFRQARKGVLSGTRVADRVTTGGRR